MNVLEIFAERIKILRQEQGLGVRELAEKLNMSHSAICLYESCRRTPDIETLKKFAEFFHVTGDYLLGISNERR